MADNDTQTPDTTPGNDGGTDTGQAPAPEVFSREYVEELRRENAKARTSKNQAVEDAKAEVRKEYEAKLAEKDTAYTELQNQLGEAWIELEKVYTTIDAKVPSDRVRAFAAILQGSDKESISESAKSAKQLFGGMTGTVPAVDPTQGSGGGKHTPLNGDPILDAIKKAVGA
ncbi:scaffolding protein [Mycobacterium phage LHTSCC]|uniref:Scaffolding protein n=5 Tax=Backyardiganvirus TaxID=2946815 RepID=A0A482JIH0_9CAUD|nr:head scaffolding protein [Mycobacterium phage Obama12]YP_009018799.1 head scaffolding protein [Mycobacterium phage LHTSCC]YP_009190873.1 head scaffolding protein [Mycobacterium phage Iracema64]YP_010062487.1 head scaffolding protein [Mycobacterium phage Cerulean]YP_010063093.1 head scaffolding protein [Mycobacterium phage Miramae]AXQ63105.1 scaffolding protein [Mycobacterium phage ChampagnePapi]QDF16097.1 scaffolding protein [Mycobacterium phage SheldonCooper]QPL14220.1 scaffolding protei